ncbi:phage tail protein, partial [Glaesserella parasuis]|nr:phage tail protein [Glaesserella parasuis]
MAGLNEIAKWEREVYQIEEDDPVLGGVKGVTNKPLKHLANRTLYLKQVLEAAGQKLIPKKLTATTRNIADSTGHTHEIDLASTTTKGLVQLTNDTGLDSESLALT